MIIICVVVYLVRQGYYVWLYVFGLEFGLDVVCMFVDIMIDGGQYIYESLCCFEMEKVLWDEF